MVSRMTIAKLALRADEIQAVVDYKRAMRASIAASEAYASAVNTSGADRLEAHREKTNARVWETLRALQEVLRDG